jgi:HCOMODA/2-hydroxy-3-carboxy-muconic semialdehyde decarboxylase
MPLMSSSKLRGEVITACRVLTHFRIAEGFGHVSTRVGKNRILITPRRALGLVSKVDLVELELGGIQRAGAASPPLEVAMHLAIYRRRPDVMAIARGHPRHVAAYACSGEPLRVAHGFGANLGAVVPVFPEPFLVTDAARAGRLADALGDGAGVILQSTGMLAVGQSVAHACVQALFMEETAEVQLKALGAGFALKFYSPQDATHRHNDDSVHEPLRAWEYYVAVARGRVK